MKKYQVSSIKNPVSGFEPLVWFSSNGERDVEAFLRH